jgi:hypothetical protein
LTTSDEPQLRARLDEAVPFAVGLLPRSSRLEALADVERLGRGRVLGRCLLETQQYEAGAFAAYVANQAEALAAAPPAAWDAAWLERLNLLTVVLRDAEVWAEVTGRRVTNTLEDLFAQLVQTDRHRLGLVFSAYAMQDATAAYRLAAKCGVNMLDEQPDAIVRNCIFPPFLNLALDRLESDRNDREKWVELLAEAALQHVNPERAVST